MNTTRPTIPLRAVLALLSTVVVVILLFSFKTPSPGGGTAVVIPSHADTPPAASAAATAAASATATATASATGFRDGTYTGQDFPNDFGDVQVQVVISGGHITDVKPLQMPYDRERSAYISQVAGPQLRQEVLDAQSAQIDSLSGATYTSYSYAQSVQSALDQARG